MAPQDGGGSVKFCMLVSDCQIQFSEHIGVNGFQIWGVFYKKNTFQVTMNWDNQQGKDQTWGG